MARESEAVCLEIFKMKGDPLKRTRGRLGRPLVLGSVSCHSRTLRPQPGRHRNSWGMRSLAGVLWAGCSKRTPRWLCAT